MDEDFADSLDLVTIYSSLFNSICNALSEILVYFLYINYFKC